MQKKLDKLAKKLNISLKDYALENEAYIEQYLPALEEFQDIFTKEILKSIFSNIENSEISTSVLLNNVVTLCISGLLSQFNVADFDQKIIDQYKFQYWPQFISNLDDKFTKAVKEYEQNRTR